MNHFLINIFLPIISSLFLLHIAFILGYFLIKRIAIVINFNWLFKAGLAILLGYGIIGYIFLLLSLIGPLNKYVIYCLCLIIFFIGFKYIIGFYKDLYIFLVQVKKWSVFEKVLLLIIILFYLFYLISALTPPYRADALAYHLPEAVNIAKQGINFPIAGLKIYGQLPALMEVLYAFLYVFAGFTLIHLIHYQIVLTLLLIVYSFIRKEFNNKSALLTVVLIFTIYKLFTNATSAYVDGATIAFELSALLIFFYWFKYQNRQSLILSGILFGLALSTKYLPLYILVIVFGLLIYRFIQLKQSWRNNILDITYLIVPCLLLAGFWYIKNLVLLVNPFFPFFFGHPGLTNQEALGFAISVRQFIPRTLLNYLFLPFKLYTHPYYLTTLLGFFLLPFSFLLKKNIIFIRLLSAFTLIYFTCLFFLISHVRRFSMLGLVFLMMIAGIVLEKFMEKYSRLLYSKYTIILFLVIFVSSIYFVSSFKDNYFFRVKKIELSYITGLVNESEFYNFWRLGGIYNVSKYINSNFNNKKIFNLWEGINFFLEKGNKYIGPSEDFILKNSFSWEKICSYLKNNNIEYLYFNQTTQDRNKNDRYFFQASQLEDNILSHSRVIYKKHDGQLAKISLNCE